MILTDGQQEALKIAIDRYRNKEKYTVIAGAAGTGKSSTVKFIIAALAEYGINPELDVVYTSFTGKACTVLQSMGNSNVRTLHKLLYEHVPKPDGTFFRKKVQRIEYKIVVVDEIGMVPQSLVEQLLTHKNIYVLFCGDEHQLPPINPKEDNHLLDHPHARLTKIMRQAEGSEIIQLATVIREGGNIGYYKGTEVQILPKSELSTGMLAWADVVLCATNATRHGLNDQIREFKGFSGDPKAGEKIICKRNYWDITSQNEEAIVNGTIGILQNNYDTFMRVPGWASGKQYSSDVQYMMGDFITETGEVYKNLEIDKKMIMKEVPCLDWKTAYKLKKSKKVNYPEPMEFMYGYAITCHAAQGSQWDQVLVIEEDFPRVPEEHRRWLYTAVTRAAKKIVLVR